MRDVEAVGNCIVNGYWSRHPVLRLPLVLTLACGPTELAAGPADAWIDLPPLPTARQEVGVAAWESRIYVIGGILSNRRATGLVERYDVERGTWEGVAPLPGGAALHHVGAAATGGRVYAVGGLDDAFRAAPTVFAFDPRAAAWSRVANLPSARGGMGVAALDGRLYAAGGQSGALSFDDFAVYSPAEDRWEVLPDMPTARNHLAAVEFEGRFYAVGGRDGRLFGLLEVYDPATRRWEQLASMPTPRAGIAAAVVGRGLYVFGGEGNSASPSGIFAETEAYHFEGDTWYSLEPMAHPRHGIGAAAIETSGARQQIHIPGGSPVQGFSVTGVHDAFRAGTPPWAAAPGLFVRGDVNGDVTVDISDPVAVLIELFGSGRGLSCADAADANDDGSVDIADPVFTLNYLFASGPPPPPPGPNEAGPDPTEDPLDCISR